MTPALLLAASLIAGIPAVHDGDTYRINGTRVRLWGVDSPELDQTCQMSDEAMRQQLGATTLTITYPCGTAARDALIAWVAGREMACTPTGGKSYDRVVAWCEVGGIDVGAWLVSNGWACDWPQYSDGAYADEQREAAAADRGIWAGRFRLVKSGVSGE